MAASAKWDDLAVRMASAVAMVAVGAVEIWIGGHSFHVLIAVICGVMVWELIRMIAPDQRGVAMQLAVLAGVAVLASSYLPRAVALPVVLAPVMVGLGMVQTRRVVWAAYAPLILLAGFSLLILRDDFGWVWMLWLVLIVVASDVMGYFAGRLIGGPKFWPRISPKKTWSGTVAGWLGAALVGYGVAAYAGAGYGLIAISVLMSFAAQMGDIAESAIKRSVGVKDASTLIPGHGGVLDRFDGMIGAAVLLLLVALAVGFPPGPA